MSGLASTGITLGCGITAVSSLHLSSTPLFRELILGSMNFQKKGVAAAILSQPADTLLSKINNQGKDVKGGIFSRLGSLAVATGPIGLFAGLGPRMVC